jgi:hypothetical protein
VILAPAVRSRAVNGDEVVAAARAVLEAAWHPGGYTAPSPERYPWQWLWDSCFHAIAWAAVGDDRGVVELDRLLGARDHDGFVPHVIYSPAVSPHADFWGRADASSITQPPMHGHALADLVRRGISVPPRTLEASADALWFLLARRRRLPGGLLQLCHPWESGADDSPRWDHWYGSRWVAEEVYRVKGELLEEVRRSPSGAPVANPAFEVASASFNALVAFNAMELASVTGDERLVSAADELIDALDERWDDRLGTWADDGASSEGSGRARTIDALVGSLVSAREDRVARALAACVDPDEHGATYGPTGVHRGDVTFDPGSYWRGSSWPQLTYLLWVAARRGGRGPEASALSSALVAGARTSGFAEHWHPDTGAGLGAIPQSWAALAAVVVTEPLV